MNYFQTPNDLQLADKSLPLELTLSSYHPFLQRNVYLDHTLLSNNAQEGDYHLLFVAEYGLL